MPTYRLDFAYLGGGFRGYAWQRGDVRTVQGELETALAHLTGPVRTEVAGRTDAGVHARQQVVSFAVEDELDPERVIRSLNRMLGPEIGVESCRRVPDDFSARFSASWRAYRYQILNRPTPDPFRAATSWHVPHPLDVAVMDLAVVPLVGEHDFASFCRAAAGRSTVRRVLEATWTRAADLVELSIRASSFCHQMVRSVVALAVDVGRGRIAADRTAAILAGRDRSLGRGVAPPHGLILWEVGYD